MSGAAARLAALGLTLPQVVAPVAAYVPAVRTGDYVYTSGQLPIVDGKLQATGKVGDSVSPEEAAALARICALNALAAAAGAAGRPRRDRPRGQGDGVRRQRAGIHRPGAGDQRR